MISDPYNLPGVKACTCTQVSWQIEGQMPGPLVSNVWLYPVLLSLNTFRKLLSHAGQSESPRFVPREGMVAGIGVLGLRAGRPDLDLERDD